MSGGSKLVCMICNASSGSHYFGIGQNLLPGGKSVSDRLNLVLSLDLDQWSAPSDVICTECFHVLGRIEYLEVLLQDTTSDVISKFLLTCGQFGLQYRLKKSRTPAAQNVSAENLTVAPENLTTVAENLTTAAASSPIGTAPLCQWYSSAAPSTSSSASQMLLLSDTVYLPEAHRAGTTSLLATLPAEAFCLDYSANPPGPINMTTEMLSAAESSAPPAATPPCSAANYPPPAAAAGQFPGLQPLTAPAAYTVQTGGVCCDTPAALTAGTQTVPQQQQQPHHQHPQQQQTHHQHPQQQQTQQQQQQQQPHHQHPQQQQQQQPEHQQQPQHNQQQHPQQQQTQQQQQQQPHHQHQQMQNNQNQQQQQQNNQQLRPPPGLTQHQPHIPSQQQHPSAQTGSQQHSHQQTHQLQVQPSHTQQQQHQQRPEQHQQQRPLQQPSDQQPPQQSQQPPQQSQQPPEQRPPAGACGRGAGCRQQCVLWPEWPGLAAGQRLRLGVVRPDGGLSCFYCPQGAAGPEALADHVRRQHRPRLLLDTALVAGRQTRYKMGLHLEHVQSTDWNGPAAARQPFVCVHCDGLYKTERSLKNHFREHHTPNLTFKCAECGELCRRYIDLSRHRLYRCQFRKQPVRPAAKRAGRGRRGGRSARTGPAARGPAGPSGQAGPQSAVAVPEAVGYPVLDGGDQALPIDLASSSCDSLYGIDYTADRKKYNFELVTM